jgi:hypothetical protein
LNANISLATKAINNKRVELVGNQFFNAVDGISFFTIKLADVIFHVCIFYIIKRFMLPDFILPLHLACLTPVTISLAPFVFRIHAAV